MQQNNNKVKSLRGEINRLQCLVAKLSGTNENMCSKLKQKDDALAKRRSEVATLHQACAKYKRAQLVFAQRLRNLSKKASTPTPSASNTSSSPPPLTNSKKKQRTSINIPPAADPSTEPDTESKPLTIAEPERVAVCSRCERMQCFFVEVGKRSDNMAQLIHEHRVESKKKFDEGMERSQQLLTETSEHFAQIRERARRQMAEALQRNEHDMVLFRRRINGHADAG